MQQLEEEELASVEWRGDGSSGERGTATGRAAGDSPRFRAANGRRATDVASAQAQDDASPTKSRNLRLRTRNSQQQLVLQQQQQQEQKESRLREARLSGSVRAITFSKCFGCRSVSEAYRGIVDGKRVCGLLSDFVFASPSMQQDFPQHASDLRPSCFYCLRWWSYDA